MRVKFVHFPCQGVSLLVTAVLLSVLRIFTEMAATHIIVVSVGPAPVFLVNHLEIQRVLVIEEPGLPARPCRWQFH